MQAIDTYHATASDEFDRMQTYFDSVDSKLAFLLTAVIAIPVAIMGFASQVPKDSLDAPALVLWGLGLLAFARAGWYLLDAIRIHDIPLGVPYPEFREYSQTWDDSAMKEWVADLLLTSAEGAYRQALEEATRVQRVMRPFIAEVLLFLSGTIYVVVARALSSQA